MLCCLYVCVVVYTDVQGLEQEKERHIQRVRMNRERLLSEYASSRRTVPTCAAAAAIRHSCPEISIDTSPQVVDNGASEGFVSSSTVTTVVDVVGSDVGARK